MVSQTNEQALEDCIERSLVDRSRYETGNPADYSGSQMGAIQSAAVGST
jgi:hypothetical protein